MTTFDVHDEVVLVESFHGFAVGLVGKVWEIEWTPTTGILLTVRFGNGDMLGRVPAEIFKKVTEAKDMFKGLECGQKAVCVKDGGSKLKIGELVKVVELGRLPLCKGGELFCHVVKEDGTMLDHCRRDYFKPLPKNDPNYVAINTLLEKQMAKGIAKYGAVLSQNPKGLTVGDMLDYLAEELTDALVYNRQLKAMWLEQEKVNKVANEVTSAIQDLAKKVEQHGGSKKASI